MASMRDIKRRKESISSTGQITKAMKLVATVKLQKAKTKAENSRPYFEHMYEAVCSILDKSGYIDHPMLTPKNASADTAGGGKRAVIVITSNRGLAGGYNSNIVKLITGGEFDPKDTLIYAVGRKGKEALARRGYEVVKDYSEAINEPIFADAAEIGAEVMAAFQEGKIREIYLAYTVFKNTVSHIPTLQKILPVESDLMKKKEEKKEGPVSVDDLTLMNYEPEADEALNLIIPKYVNSLIYGALTTAIASENGARMQAMDSATSNAEDMISDLELKYNRARQGAITQELTEIIAGANAIS